jgi:adenine phosphoribosyltransferase
MLQHLIRDIPDFPKPGIVFKDITPLLGNPAGFTAAIEGIATAAKDQGITRVVGIESRGFILAAPVALRLGVGFVPIRKPGKLPCSTHRQTYALEYGIDAIEIHRDALQAGERVLLVDDVLATGGTMAAAETLVRTCGAVPVVAAFLIELGFLNGAAKLGCPTHAVLRY